MQAAASLEEEEEIYRAMIRLFPKDAKLKARRGPPGSSAAITPGPGACSSL